jgi:CheY-like chemotaxis protein
MLLVEDAEDVREIACLSLERVGGWSVVPVSSGEAALAAVAGGMPFDAILLDVMMPGMDGRETLRRLRDGALPADVPIVFLTAWVKTADRQGLRDLGAAGVIAKPFDPIALPGELKRVLAEAQSTGDPQLASVKGTHSVRLSCGSGPVCGTPALGAHVAGVEEQRSSRRSRRPPGRQRLRRHC